MPQKRGAGTGRGGRKPLTAARDLYLRLVADGMSNKAACEAVGVKPRTGYRWKNGRTEVTAAGTIITYPPVTSSDAAAAATAMVAKGRYLSAEERMTIAMGHQRNRSARDIAAQLGRPTSTVTRELARNTDPATGHYHPTVADQLAEKRRKRPKIAKMVADNQLRNLVQDCLTLRWSPQQISRWLAKTYPDRPELRVSHETIYQALFVQGRGELRRELTAALRTGRAMRKRHRRELDGRGRIPNMIMLSERPAEVADRAVPGHWEGDLIMGAGSSPSPPS